MIVIVGCIVVIGAVLGGFMLAGGHVGALIHPSEILTIGGASLGAMIVMSPKKVLIDLVRACCRRSRARPSARRRTTSCSRLMYDLLRTGAPRRLAGPRAAPRTIRTTARSSTSTRSCRKNHHVIDFICGALVAADGRLGHAGATAGAVRRRAEGDGRRASRCRVACCTKTADALPGFGIVAAVLGIVITMGHIDGPVAEIGHKVGAALVGTFLGILLSYGFFAPLAVRMEFLGASELAFFSTIRHDRQASPTELPPKVGARAGPPRRQQRSAADREQLEEMFKEVDAA